MIGSGQVITGGVVSDTSAVLLLELFAPQSSVAETVTLTVAGDPVNPYTSEPVDGCVCPAEVDHRFHFYGAVAICRLTLGLTEFQFNWLHALEMPFLDQPLDSLFERSQLVDQCFVGIIFALQVFRVLVQQIG